MAADPKLVERQALDPLFDNHLAFLGTHRGTVEVARDWIELTGQSEKLSSWTPLRDDLEIPPHVSTVRLIPASGPGWPAGLARAGFSPSEALNYMELPADHRSPTGANSCDIRLVESDAEAEAFANIQAAAFLDPDGPDTSWWVDCFQRMALANYARPEQEFLIAWLDHRPAAVLLTVDTPAVTGIYAVATAPQFQRRGLSIALLNSARSRAAARGTSRLILQAMVGSYAEGFYRRLGFQHRYYSQVWRRGS